MGESFQCLLGLNVGPHEPDVFTLDANSHLQVPSSFVISRSQNGEIVSRFGDDVWDLAPYRTTFRGAVRISFDHNPEDHAGKYLKEECKRLLFVAMYFPYKHGRGELTVGTLCGSYGIFLRSVSKFCYDRKCSLADFLGDMSLIAAFMRKQPSGGQLQTLSAFLTRLRHLDPQVTGFRVVGIKDQNLIKNAIANLKTFQNQTPVMPSRIYIEIINSLTTHIERFNKARIKLEKFVDVVSSSKTIGRTKGTQKAMLQREAKKLLSSSMSQIVDEQVSQVPKSGPRKVKYELSFDELASSIGLRSYFSEYKIENFLNLTSHFTSMQMACKVLLIAYSGMRSSEADSLLVGCLDVENTTKGKVYRLYGYTSKLVGYRNRVSWITCDYAEQVVKAARTIADMVRPFAGADEEKCPLFISTTYLPFTNVPVKAKHEEITITNLSLDQSRFMELLVNIVITQDDLNELKKIEPFRDWETDEVFTVGVPWSLAYHQFRRTLAVYAARSGLVSIPSLRRQLKHITRDMTLYYAKGSPDAEDLFGNDPTHFRYEFEKVKPEMDALAYIYDVLLSEETLVGGHGKWVEKFNKPQDKDLILASREETINRFRKGELAYKETPLGGCTTVEPCEKKAMRAVSACISCHKAVIKPSKIAKVIDAQSRLVDSMDKSSMVYRMEMEHLNELKRLDVQRVGEGV